MREVVCMHALLLQAAQKQSYLGTVTYFCKSARQLFVKNSNTAFLQYSCIKLAKCKTMPACAGCQKDCLLRCAEKSCLADIGPNC